MKKIVMTLVGISLIALGIYFFVSGKDQQSEYQDYIVALNEDSVFDITFSESSYVQYSVPFYTPSLPMENYHDLSQLTLVENVRPFYPIFIYDEHNGNPVNFTYWQSNDINKQTVAMPLEINYGDGSVGYMNEFRIKPVTDKKQFQEVYMNSNKGAILKTFNTDSGVYISRMLYDTLKLDENDNELHIQVPVQIPVVAQMVESELDIGDGRLRNVIGYEAVKYELVDVTLDVQGVIDSSSGLNFYLGIDLVVPYEMTEEIFAQVNPTTLSLEENQKYWKPNTYIVRCEGDVKIAQLGEAIESEIGSCFVSIYDHGKDSGSLNYLFKDGKMISDFKP